MKKKSKFVEKIGRKNWSKKLVEKICQKICQKIRRKNSLKKFVEKIHKIRRIGIHTIGTKVTRKL